MINPKMVRITKIGGPSRRKLQKAGGRSVTDYYTRDEYDDLRLVNDQIRELDRKTQAVYDDLAYLEPYFNNEMGPEAVRKLKEISLSETPPTTSESVLLNNFIIGPSIRYGQLITQKLRSMGVIYEKVTGIDYRLRVGCRSYYVNDLALDKCKSPLHVTEYDSLLAKKKILLARKNAHRREDLDEVTSDILHMMTNEYKIHLMPKDEDIGIIMLILGRLIAQDEEVRSLMDGFKVKILLEKCSVRLADESISPTIVFYTYSKECTQRFLGIIYELFRDWDGRNVAPDYNNKVTNFIYFTQSDRDLKNDPDLKELYDHRINYTYFINDLLWDETDFHLHM
jgi:hypothetical protein